MKRALVIGGGVAGPATAMALQKAGLDPVVYEARRPGEALGVGAYLTIAVNGLAALSIMDVHRPVMAAGVPSSTLAFYASSGKHMASMPIGGTLPDGTITHSIKRADLYQVLNDEAVKRGVRYEYGKRLASAGVTPEGGVVATFADGSTAEGDVLIGADGIHSVTRKLIDPAAPAPRYIGLCGAGGFARGVPGLEAVPGDYNMLFGKRGFFGYLVAPDGEVWWFANLPEPRELSPGELAAISPAGWRRRLLELFASDNAPATRIVQATRDEDLVCGFNQYDMPSVPVWNRGPIGLVGDAAHAVASSSGQGCSMAFEDALVLATCLRDVPDTALALAAFERLRRERVEAVVAHGAKTSADKAAKGLARVIINLLTPYFLRKAAKSGVGPLSWMFEHRIDWDRRVEAAAGVVTVRRG